jgi:hypothetical protein
MVIPKCENLLDCADAINDVQSKISFLMKISANDDFIEAVNESCAYGLYCILSEIDKDLERVGEVIMAHSRMRSVCGASA